MSYRNKTYIAFNADYPTPKKADMWAYAFMLGWKSNDKVDFDFHNAHDLNVITSAASERQIRIKLQERMEDSKALIVIVGEHTKNMHKFVRWEQEIAIEMGIPIVAANLDNRTRANERTPKILMDNARFVSVPFKMAAIKHALDNFPSEFCRDGGHSKPAQRYYPHLEG